MSLLFDQPTNVQRSFQIFCLKQSDPVAPIKIISIHHHLIYIPKIYL